MSILIREDYANTTTPLWAVAGSGGTAGVIEVGSGIGTSIGGTTQFPTVNNEGVLDITATLGIEVSAPTGSITIQPTFVFGGFYSDSTQPIGSANTPQALKFATTYSAQNMNLDSGDNTRINIEVKGNYRVVQNIFLSKSGGGVSLVDTWWRVNGIDVPLSLTTTSVQNATGRVRAGWNRYVTLNAGDYIQFMIACADTDVSATFQPAQTSPYTHPSGPSVGANLEIIQFL